MKVTRYAKWIVSQGSEGFTVELTPEDIGMKSAGDINVALDQIRLLQYLTTYILYSRMRADGVMQDKMFADSMAKFGYEHALVEELLSSMAVDKTQATQVDSALVTTLGPTDAETLTELDKLFQANRAAVEAMPDIKIKSTGAGKALWQ